MVLATRCLENTFFKEVFIEITTFDAPKAAKKGSKDKQKAWQVARKPLRGGWGGGEGPRRGL